MELLKTAIRLLEADGKLPVNFLLVQELILIYLDNT